MPDKIRQLPLTKKRLKISTNEIYNPAGGGLSEAVVRLSIGCTGEFVSTDGLILTNHHCGYDALVAASSPQNNYGKNGYKADSRLKELPAKDYSITITLKSLDVTAEVINGINSLPGSSERAEIIHQKIQKLQAEAQSQAGKNVVVQIQSINDGAFYYEFHYLTLKDVRIAYAPPKNIGFFGGDVDNFEWTQQRGDFTFMRAYVASDGSPAEYSINNVPYKPRKILTLSTNGVKENDFVFALGYPGTTTRYRESYSIAYNQAVRMPFLIDYDNGLIAAYEEAGRNDSEKRVKYQGEIANLANGRKALEGGRAALYRGDLLSRKRAEEDRFNNWVNADPARKAKYGEVLAALNQAYTSEIAPSERSILLQLMPGRSAWQIILQAASVALEKEKPELQQNQKLLAGGAKIKIELAENLQDRDLIYDRELLLFFLKRAAQLAANIKIKALEERFGGLADDERRKAEKEFVLKATAGRFSSAEGLSELFVMSAARMRESNDPVLQTMIRLAAELQKAQANNREFNSIVTRYRPLLLEGISKMNKISPYPDANSTLRFTYGSVKGYKPREAVSYTPFTTLTGLMEKDTGYEPFDVPQKLRELWRSKDFGNYGVNGSVPVNFLNNIDIIGGNSGSPVINAFGEQVGIVFDLDYEGLGNDFFVNPELNRPLAVDIRYVLFITDKFANAGWIVRELNVKGSKAKSAKK